MSINQNWIFGDGVKLDFGATPPTPSTITGFTTAEGCASISDAGGHLLFYTDGSNIWDGGGTVRVTGLLGNPSSTQSAIIVPDPGDASRYYVFTADGASGGNNHVAGVRVNISTWATTPILSLINPAPVTTGLSPTEKITAIQHANCTDYWVITVVQSGNNALPSGQGAFRVFHVTAAGVSLLPDAPFKDTIHDLGYLKGSPDGKLLALANWQPGSVLVYTFNNATGAITPAQTVAVPATAPGTPYGVEFSPDSQLLYFTVLGNGSSTGTAGDGYLLQVDLASGHAVPLAMHPNVDGSYYALGALQLGMDGVIYVAMPGEKWLGTIATPNTIGAGCNLTLNSIPLGAACKLGLPNLLPNPCTRPGCGEIIAGLNKYYSKECGKKRNVLAPCREGAKPCGCGSPNPEVPHEPCRPVEFPRIEPCITVSWGDSRCDCMETDDFEVLCITVCNCYTNATFSNFRIGYVYVTTDTGATVPLLPDGTLSVEAVPRGPICFGDIGPCKDGVSTCVSRQFVVLTRGAKGGSYQLKVGGVCFDVVHHYDGEACFQLALCADR